VGFLDKLFSREPPSKDIAKRRLRLVLVHDRQLLSPGLMRAIREEIIVAISKHVQVDADKTELTLAEGAGCHNLVANIPIIGRARQDN
jgi:cell division topological specificity factor